MTPGQPEKACPRCPTVAVGREEVEERFGHRRNGGRLVPQSWCRRCRAGSLPVGAFRTVLADPAWSYNNSARLRGVAAEQYATMTTREIAELPVEAVTARDAVCLLWSTNPLLPDALRVMDAWGFTYKTKLTWCKNTFGPGFWLRSQSEDLLIGTKGKPPKPRVAPSSVLHADNPGHSRKPRPIYPVAEALGAAPRLELFARQRRQGWAAWGNELSRHVEAALEVAS
jgi:N6-adenosine-specific RNA methylase IME4